MKVIFKYTIFNIGNMIVYNVIESEFETWSTKLTGSLVGYKISVIEIAAFEGSDYSLRLGKWNDHNEDSERFITVKVQDSLKPSCIYLKSEIEAQVVIVKIKELIKKYVEHHYKNYTIKEENETLTYREA